MGRFKAEGIIVREISDIRIIFWNSHVIYVDGPFGMVAFHRYYAPRGSYGAGWGDFRRKMLRYKELTWYSVFRVAAQFFDVVEVQSTDCKLDFKDKTVYVWGRYTKNNAEAIITTNYKLEKGWKR